MLKIYHVIILHLSVILRGLSNTALFQPIGSNEIRDLIMNLKVTKSVIGLPQKIIKLACDYIIEPLTEIFNQSLLRGVVPEILKISKITPINKGRPISTLSVFTKIFEKIGL